MCRLISPPCASYGFVPSSWSLCPKLPSCPCCSCRRGCWLLGSLPLGGAFRLLIGLLEAALHTLLQPPKNTKGKSFLHDYRCVLPGNQHVNMAHAVQCFSFCHTMRGSGCTLESSLNGNPSYSSPWQNKESGAKSLLSVCQFGCMLGLDCRQVLLAAFCHAMNTMLTP